MIHTRPLFRVVLAVVRALAETMLFGAFGLGAAVLADTRLLPLLRGDGHLLHPARISVLGLAPVFFLLVRAGLYKMVPERLFPRARSITGARDTSRKAEAVAAPKRPARRFPRGLRAHLAERLPALFAGAMIPLALAFAEPESHLGFDVDETAGIDILVCLDVSESMRAAFVVPGSPPPAADPRILLPTRFDVAKERLAAFLERRPDDRIGLIVFGRKAWLAVPPTTDKTLLVQRLRALVPGEIDGSRTAMGDAIAAAVAKLDRSQARARRILLLSDGDTTAGTDPSVAAKIAERHGVVIDTLQVGDGGLAKIFQRWDEHGLPVYVEDEFPVDAAALAAIAAQTGGHAYRASDAEGLNQVLVSVLDTLEKTSFPTRKPRFVPLAPPAYLGASVLVGIAILLRMLFLGENG